MKTAVRKTVKTKKVSQAKLRDTRSMTADQLQKMKTYAAKLHTSFGAAKRVPVSMMLIAGFLAPSLPFDLNAALAEGANLVPNASVETGGELPDSWSKGGWGANTAALTYPVAGIDGAKAMRVDIAEHTNGDAKWYFSHVPVKGGTTYIFSDSYLSDIESEADVQYQTASGTTSYLYLGPIPASTSTTTKSFTFTMPADAVTATVFHLIAKTGYLITDNYSLSENIVTPADTIPPTVSITSPTEGSSITGTSTVTATAADNVGVSGVQFILDGSALGEEDIASPYSAPIIAGAGSHTLSARARDAAGNTATSTAVSFTVTESGVDDTIAPTSAITSPAEGSTISATTTISVNASDNVGVAGVALYVNNAMVGLEDTTAPFEFFLDTNAYANGTYSIIAKARDAANNVTPSAPVSVTITNTPLSDETAPEVHLILPLDGSAVATTTSLSFGATDNVGVAGVSLFIDGLQVGAEDTVSPFEFAWDTTSYTNDSHSVYAKARDAAGNSATSTTASLTVNNIVLPPNLIENPLLETAGTNGDPSGWFRGSWGTNNAVFTYPTVGMDDGKAATVNMTNYVSGDAKWYFADVPVTGGKTYSYTDSYRSTVMTDIVAQMRTPSGIIYQYIDTVPASADWKTESFNIAVPAGVTALTIFHSIYENGTLSVDNFSLTQGSTPLPPSQLFSRGMISLSFDDGWITQYADAFPILSAAGITGTFYIISQETLNANPTELIANPTLETIGTNGDPENWFRGGWGANTAVHTYPVAGVSGNAAKLEVTNYANGDAKWYFGDTAVTPNENYILSDKYKSNTSSMMTLRYTMQDGTMQYVDIATIPSSNGVWRNFIKTITIPANVASVTAFHLLNTNGTLTVDNYSLSKIATYINQAQMLEIQNAGNEIGGHTQRHVSLTGNLEDGVTVTPEQANAEIVGSRTDLLGMGITPLTTMAYPYGDFNSSVITMVKNSGYTAARSVERGFNLKNTDKFALKIQQMDRTTVMTDVQSWVSQAAKDKTWLILMFHQEDNNPLHDLGVTPEFLQQIVDYIGTADVDIITVDQGVSRMNP